MIFRGRNVSLVKGLREVIGALKVRNFLFLFESPKILKNVSPGKVEVIDPPSIRPFPPPGGPLV